MGKFIQLDEKDNVVVAVTSFNVNDVLNIDGSQIKIQNKIAVGSMFAVKNLIQRDTIIKSGHVVGIALVDISAGELVHIHNSTSL